MHPQRQSPSRLPRSDGARCSPPRALAWRSRSRLPTRLASRRVAQRRLRAKPARPCDERQMVVAANPYAADAGLAVLRDGGNAADALIAVQTVLGLVEPQSSGLGGGGFLTWYDAGDQDAHHLRRARDGAGGGDAATVPRQRRQAARLLRRGGRRPLGRRARHSAAARNCCTSATARSRGPSLFAPAIELSENGFSVSARLNMSIGEDVGRLDLQPATRAYFFDAAGAPLAVGTRARQPALCRDAAGDRRRRRRRLLQGQDRRATSWPRSPAIRPIRAASASPTSPATRSRSGRRSARPIAAIEVCGMGPPSSGALTIGQILGMVEPFDIATLGPDDPADLAHHRRRDPPRLRRSRALHRRQRFREDAERPARSGLPQGAQRADPARPTALGKDDVRPASRPGTRPNCAATRRRWSCRRPRTSSSSMPTATSPR